MALIDTVDKGITKVHTNLSLYNFHSTVKGKFGEDFAKSARYYVKFGSIDPVGSELSYLCDAAEFPGRGFTQQTVRHYGPEFKVPVSTEYEDLTLSIMVRDYWEERRYFDSWMNRINPINQYNFSYRNEYASNIEIYPIMEIGQPEDPNQPVPGAKGRESGVVDELKVFGSNSNPGYISQYRFVFESAWPVLLSPLQISWADDNIVRLNVQFTFRRWYVDEYEIRFTGLPPEKINGYGQIYSYNSEIKPRPQLTSYWPGGEGGEIDDTGSGFLNESA